MNMPPKSVALFFSPVMRFWLLSLARTLKERFGTSVHGYCTTREEIDFYQQHGAGILESIQNLESSFRRPETPADEEALYQTARDWEKIIGCTFGFLTPSNRHYGRGYALAGTGHPRSRMSEQGRMIDVIAGYVAHTKSWDREFKEKKFDLIINAPPVAARLARAYNVPYRAILNARMENLFYWSEDEFYWTSRVEAAWKKLQSSGTILEPKIITKSHDVITTYRKRFERDSSFIRLLRRLVYMTAQRLWHHYKGYEKARQYYLFENLRYVTREWIDTKRMTGPKTVKLRSLRGKSFVFFPLHTEPESSVGQMSPEFFFQHAAIAALARDLPAGAVLAVKETIAGVGRRPLDFYKAIADLKNVVWLDMMEQGPDIVPQASAVATITGTAGMEAAVMGKPVITFGQHNVYNFLPHVHVIDSLRDLSPILSSIIAGQYDQEAAVQAGACYAEAIRVTSFAMGTHNYRFESDFDPTVVESGIASLLSTLDQADQSRIPA